MRWLLSPNGVTTVFVLTLISALLFLSMESVALLIVMLLLAIACGYLFVYWAVCMLEGRWLNFWSWW